ncbi:MAG: Gx transporter family protein [Clostridiales bacterium]|jgi:heptaprenyl diphosphate synthase|nr:Gx transporter family protein [Clostridiales bacterium]
MATKRLTITAFFTAAALILGLIENALPPVFAFAPGVKLGLANVVSLVALIILGAGEAYAVLLIRCLLLSVFSGNISGLMYSLPAGFAALTVQTLLYLFVFPRVSLMLISLAAAAVHNAAQLAVASAVVRFNLFAILPLTLTAGVIAGLFVGITAYYAVRLLPKSLYIQNSQNKTESKNGI